jgi:peptidyl-prolyl cis-trans isomerase B (cyclophilin B)
MFKKGLTLLLTLLLLVLAICPTAFAAKKTASAQEQYTTYLKKYATNKDYKWTQTQLGDYNHDGKPDMLVIRGNTLQAKLLENQSNFKTIKALKTAKVSILTIQNNKVVELSALNVLNLDAAASVKEKLNYVPTQLGQQAIENRILYTKSLGGKDYLFLHTTLEKPNFTKSMVVAYELDKKNALVPAYNLTALVETVQSEQSVQLTLNGKNLSTEEWLKKLQLYHADAKATCLYVADHGLGYIMNKPKTSEIPWTQIFPYKEAAFYEVKPVVDPSTKNDPIATLTLSDGSQIKIQLYPTVARNTVNNFIDLSNKGFYDGLTFHRVISGFMVQGGDPSGNGTGGPNYSIKGEFTSNGVQNDLAHTRGVLSMARAADPDSAGSQFFIMHADAPFLDGNYAAFGKVISGIELVDKIAAVKTDSADAPLEKIVIKKINIDLNGYKAVSPVTIKQ